MTYKEAQALVHKIEKLEEMLKGINDMSFLMTDDIFGFPEEVQEEAQDILPNMVENMTAKINVKIEMLKLGFMNYPKYDIKFPIKNIRSTEQYQLVFEDSQNVTHYICDDGDYDGFSKEVKK